MISAFLALHHWSASELPGAHDQGAIQKAALLQVRNERSQRDVSLPSILAMIGVALAVAVPVTVVEMDEPHPALHHPPRQQTDAAKFCRRFIIQSVHLANGFRFFGEIDQFGACHLHPKGQLVIADPGGKTRVIRAFGQVPLVPGLQLVEDDALARSLETLGRRQIFKRCSFSGNDCGLEDRGQKSGANNGLAVS